jgi:hypothetical protein
MHEHAAQEEEIYLKERKAGFEPSPLLEVGLLVSSNVEIGPKWRGDTMGATK